MELTSVNKDCLCCYRQVRNSRKFQAPCWDSTSVYELSLYTKWRAATGQSIQNQEVWNNLESLQRALLLYSYLVVLGHQHEEWWTPKNSNLSLRYTLKLYISWTSTTQYDSQKILFMNNKHEERVNSVSCSLCNINLTYRCCVQRIKDNITLRQEAHWLCFLKVKLYHNIAFSQKNLY